MMLVMVNESKKREKELWDLEKMKSHGPFTGKKWRQANGEEWEGGSWVSVMVGHGWALVLGWIFFSISFSSSFILLFF